MGPIEALFITLVVIFGIVGIVRGYHRELGVTALLLVSLLLLEFLESFFPNQLNAAFTALGGSNVNATKGIVYGLFLVVVAFISYQGDTLTFPGGSGGGPVLGLLVGLLNGYLFAGSLWYYLQRGGWPLLRVNPNYTEFYNAALRVLPPAVLDWKFILLLVIVMFILRVWR